jgi:hypothetical protein
MSTRPPRPSLEAALATIPTALRRSLIKQYSALKSEALQAHADTVGHQAGKLAEALLRVGQHLLTGNYTPLSQSLTNFKSQCDALENTPKAAGPEGIRILLPRALLFLYTLRNKRDFGHIGGEVSANKVDSATATRLADWCMCELVRVCHNIPLEDAQTLCDSIAERKIAVIWNILGRKRILDTALSYPEQTLLLLYSDTENAVAVDDLYEWAEHSRKANYKRDVIQKLHHDRLIEYDEETDMAIISPTGISRVENSIIPKIPLPA